MYFIVSMSTVSTTVFEGIDMLRKLSISSFFLSFLPFLLSFSLGCRWLDRLFGHVGKYLISFSVSLIFGIFGSSSAPQVPRYRCVLMYYETISFQSSVSLVRAIHHDLWILFWP